MAFTTPRDWTAGEFVTEAIMDTHVRDNFLAMGSHLIVRKTADESVTSSTVFQADDSLILPVGVSEVWKWELCLLVTAAAAGDIKVQWTFPAGGTFSAVAYGVSSADVAQITQWATTTTPTGAAFFGSTGFSVNTTATPIAIQGVYTNAGTGGSVTLEWAQQTSNATATVVKANSTLWAVKLA